MTVALVIALIISHGLMIALGAWGHYMLGAHLMTPRASLRTDVQERFGSSMQQRSDKLPATNRPPWDDHP